MHQIYSNFFIIYAYILPVFVTLFSISYNVNTDLSVKIFQNTIGQLCITYSLKFIMILIFSYYFNRY